MNKKLIFTALYLSSSLALATDCPNALFCPTAAPDPGQCPVKMTPKAEGKMDKGDLVINIEKKNAYGIILGQENDGQLIVRYIDGSLSGQTESRVNPESLATTIGCDSDICTDDFLVDTTENGGMARVVGLQNHGRFVVEYSTGRLLGTKKSFKERTDFALMKGCSDFVCVENKKVFIHVPTLTEVFPMAVQVNHQLVVKGITTGSLMLNVMSDDLAKTEGCLNGLCVGQPVFNSRTNVKAVVSGITKYGRFITLDLEGTKANSLTGLWSAEDLVSAQHELAQFIN